MSNIQFICPFCKQPLETPIDMAGQLTDCPSCKKVLEIPQHKRSPEVDVQAPPSKRKPLPRPLMPAPGRNATFSSSGSPLSKIIAVLISISIMAGAYFAYNLWEDRNNKIVEVEKEEAKARAEAPIILAAKKALDQIHKLESAIGIGVDYQNYIEELILVADKTDNLLRVAGASDIENIRREVNILCEHIEGAQKAFKNARQWWDVKIKYQDKDSEIKADGEMQKYWAIASDSINKADAIFSRIKNK